MIWQQLATLDHPRERGTSVLNSEFPERIPAVRFHARDRELYLRQMRYRIDNRK